MLVMPACQNSVNAMQTNVMYNQCTKMLLDSHLCVLDKTEFFHFDISLWKCREMCKNQSHGFGSLICTPQSLVETN